MTFAAKTEVSVEKTRMELDALLSRYGASQRMMGTDDELGIAFAAFTIAKRQVRLRVPLPKMSEVQRGPFPQGFAKRPAEKQNEWCRRELEQRQRSRWRALAARTKRAVNSRGAL